MLSPLGKDAGLPSEESILENAPRILAPEPLLSPSIRLAGTEKIPAFEVKFVLPLALADEVQLWATRCMEPDPYAGPGNDGAYQTTTLYLDTPQRDVFHRRAKHKNRKFRLRRYGDDSRVYLERKTRRGDRVSKRRSDVALDELDSLTSPLPLESWPGEWFRTRIDAAVLRPACRITYDRAAFMLRTPDGSLRLTLDRRIRGLPTDAWDLTPVALADSPIDAALNHAGCTNAVLTDQVVCELKFRSALPNVFKQLIYKLNLVSGSFSKYRRTMAANGLSVNGLASKGLASNGHRDNGLEHPHA